MSSGSNKDDINKELTFPEILMEAQNAPDCLLPSNTKDIYKITYDNFILWKNNKNARSFSENVFLAYFYEMGKKYKPSSLWSIYDMLKSTVQAKNYIDIKNYSNLTAYLKKCSDGYRSRNSMVLSSNDIENFLKEAPDSQYLATKVALIFGITGACRLQDLCNITTKDIENHGKMLLVKITNINNQIPRSFTIHGPFYDKVKQYEALRSANAKSDRFFQNFQKGKCIRQPIGINKFGSMPKEIANYLKLPDADCYIGHCFLRTSATLLADSDANRLTLKRHSGWQSNTVEESYVEDSIQNKEKIGAQTTQAIKLDPIAKKFCPEPHPSTSYDNSVSVLPTSTNVNQHIYDNVSLSSTFTQDDALVNTKTQTLPMPSKAPVIYFKNCTITNCFFK